MKQLFAAIALVVVFGFGFFAGHRYTAKNLAPGTIDFDFVEKFISLVDNELDEHHQSRAWGWGVETTFQGPVLVISAATGSGKKDEKKFEQNIRIREDIINKVLSFRADGFIDEDIEKVRPLAKEIAKKIMEVQTKN